ncbi:MAG: adenine deaminase [Phycisphaerae bacterium]
MDLRDRIDVAAGRKPADLVLRGGRIVNVCSGEIHDGDVAILGDRIVGIGAYEGAQVVDVRGRYICPGLIDGHVHIESSLLNVPQFARTVAAHGTTAVIADPHEIANVMGAEGLRYILSASKYCPIHVFVMVSSCVPASRFESAGAELTAEDITPLLADRWVVGLAEMMNYPGVVAGDAQCLEKLALADGRPIDGHAPGLSGRDLCAYAAAGIASDHECTTLEEAREKLRLGMHIMIREGSQARNLDALLPLVRPETLDRFMFVTDDKDVDDLLREGHIDHMLRRAVAAGMNPVHAVRMASVNAARYFRLHQLGEISPGKLASIAIFDDLLSFRTWRVYHAGRLVVDEGVCIDRPPTDRRLPVLRSSVNVPALSVRQFAIAADGAGELATHVIEVMEDRIDTRRSIEVLPVSRGALQPDPARDIAKIAVVERHQASGRVGKGFVRGFGFLRGALGSSVGHDSHNLVVVGTSDEELLVAAEHIVKMRGGFCAVQDGKVLADVPLPIGGLMSDADARTLSNQLRILHEAARQIAPRLRRPFMALSFLTLSVIGTLKVTDQGLVDVERFELIDPIVAS